MNDTDKLAELVRQHPAGLAAGFRPCAFYDDRLDCIRVVTRDCSVVEERLNDRITVLVDAYHPREGKPDDFEYVGFTIKGARLFCRQHGFSTRTIKMTSLLDALLKEYPDLVVRMFVQLVARPMIEQKKIDQVDIREAAMEPA